MARIFESMKARLMAFIRNLVKKVANITNSIENNELDSNPANMGETWFRRYR